MSATTSEPVKRELVTFIGHARSRGLDHGTIRHLLLSAGWDDNAIVSAFATEALEMPIPMAPRKGGAREVYYHLSAFTCIYVSVVSLLLLLFSLLDLALPDSAVPAWKQEATSSSIRSTVSTFVVFFPLYLLLNWRIRREKRRGEIVTGSAVERWMTYLTLFVILMTLLVDASTLIYLLLKGEMTVRVLLKGFVTFFVVGGSFVYLRMGTSRWTPNPSSENEPSSRESESSYRAHSGSVGWD